MHKIHHSRIEIETNSNYSSLLSIWDWLFRTYRKRDNYKEVHFGLVEFDKEENQTLIGLLKLHSKI